MSIVQNPSIVDSSNLQTKLYRMKERFENCIIKKENEYAKLWNDWYKKCEECKYDKISYNKAYNDMQQKIERLQAQLGDQKGKSKDTSCVSNTLDPLSQKLENENVELEFQCGQLQLGKDDSEPTHSSNVDIPNIHEHKQTLDLSAGTSINVQKEQSFDFIAGTSFNVKQENLRVWLLKKLISHKPVSQWIHK
ncbi:hypothetical protein Tco_0072555 [Tanacetum coccineum]